MDKKKVIMLGGGAIAAGAFLYSQRGTEGALGTVGNIIAAPVEAFTGAPDTGVEGTKKDAGQQIVDILSGLPELPGAGPDVFSVPPTGNVLSPTNELLPPTPKKSFSARSMGVLSGVARVGATSVMAPPQALGGGVAKATTAGIRYAMGTRYPVMQKAQRERVKKYPRASHAVSMVTGGVTARAPVSKKQYAARQKYPRVYKAWKSMFKWVGA